MSLPFTFIGNTILDGDWSALSSDEQGFAVRLLRKALLVADDSNITLRIADGAATITRRSAGLRYVHAEDGEQVDDPALVKLDRGLEGDGGSPGEVNARGRKVNRVSDEAAAGGACDDEKAVLDVAVDELVAVDVDDTGNGNVAEGCHAATLADPGAGTAPTSAGAGSSLRPGDQGQDPDLVAPLGDDA